MQSQHPLLWILTSAILSIKKNYFTVTNCTVLPNLVCFRNFVKYCQSFQAAMIFFQKSLQRPVLEGNQNKRLSFLHNVKVAF